MEKNLSLRIRPDSYETTVSGVYKVEGFLDIRFPYSSEDVTGSRARASIKFSMEGFWSEESRKLCMVGSAPWKGFDRDAVLKLKFGDENPSIYTGVASGSLESVYPANHQAYFDPILIFSFPQVPNYNYSLVPKEIEAMFPSDAVAGRDDSLSPEETEFCRVIEWGMRSLELEYVKEEFTVKQQPSHAGSPLVFLPLFMSLTSNQCSEGEEKAMFVATFQNHSYYSYHEFGVGTTLIGELQWDGEKKRMVGVACQILNPSQHFGDAVGDCTIRLSLRFPSILNIRNDAKIVGQIWSSKPLLRRISVAERDVQGLVSLRGLRYEYTELDRARKLLGMIHIEAACRF